MDQVHRDLRKGDHNAAIAKLNDLLDDSSAKAIVSGILGAEYLKMGRVDDALPHLKAAVQLKPSLPGNHSNLGYAMCLTGHCDRGEAEIRAALDLDHGCPEARYLIGVILMERSDPEALDHLRFAEKDVPEAHLAQALYYARRARMDLAKEQLLAYLGPRGATHLPAAQSW